MKRIYKYKGFEVSVVLEPVWKAAGGVTLLPPLGYIAIVHIRLAGVPMAGPIRLTGDAQRPFPREPDALMAGFSAGQRVVDDMLIE
jgi:hypothetical protein